MWIDSGKEDQLTGYNLGFADIIDGQLKIVDSGIFAVAGGHGVQRIQAPSTAEKNQIKRKVNTIYRRMKAKFPNDRFPFDPPFPEVKTMEELQAVDNVMAEVKEKFFGPIIGATSFSDLSAMEAVRQSVQKVFKTVYGFQELASNIARQSETPGDLVSGLQKLTKEMASIFENMDFTTDDLVSESDKALTTFINESGDDNWEVNQKGNGALLKNANGDLFFYGRFTNNLWDRDNEVLVTEAHKEFVDYLDSHPDEAPELWDWHEPETAKTHRAIWWDYADGFLHAIWPLTEEEAKGIEDFMEEFEPGMSHGFKVLERDGDDPRQIFIYRTNEASILPLEEAANLATMFSLLADEIKEEENKMFTPKKQRALELLSLGKFIQPLGKASEEDAQALDEAGIQRKENSDIMEDVENKDQEAEVPETPETTETPETKAPDLSQLESLQASIVEGFQMLTDQVKGLAEQVEANKAALEGIKTAKGQSPSVAAWVAAQKSGTAIGHEEDQTENGEKHRRRREDPLFGDGPEEEPYEIDGHLLSSL